METISSLSVISTVPVTHKIVQIYNCISGCERLWLLHLPNGPFKWDVEKQYWSISIHWQYHNL